MSEAVPTDPDAAHLPIESDDEFEEICSDEVDRVVEALEGLAATVESENIRYYLEEASLKIYLLIYGDEDSPQTEAA